MKGERIIYNTVKHHRHSRCLASQTGLFRANFGIVRGLIFGTEFMQKIDRAVLSTFIEFFKSLQISEFASYHALKHDPDAKIVITGFDEKIYNSIFLKHPHDIDSLVDELIAIKRNLGKPLTVWITAETKAPGLENVLKERFESPGPFYGMMLELAKANLCTFPEGVTIEEVKNQAQANDFAKIFSKVFNFASLQNHITTWLIKQYKADKPCSINYLARVDGVPAGACSLFLDKTFHEFKTGGFYNACVMPEFRKSGIGTAMACHRIDVARKMGLEYLSIVLMSDAMARGYCERLGFINHETMTPYYIS